MNKNEGGFVAGCSAYDLVMGKLPADRHTRFIALRLSTLGYY